jgi:hypothetical protein
VKSSIVLCAVFAICCGFSLWRNDGEEAFYTGFVALMFAYAALLELEIAELKAPKGE